MCDIPENPKYYGLMNLGEVNEDFYRVMSKHYATNSYLFIDKVFEMGATSHRVTCLSEDSTSDVWYAHLLYTSMMLTVYM